MTKPNTQNFTPANAADINMVPHRTMQFASAPVGLGLCLLGLVISFCVLCDYWGCRFIICGLVILSLPPLPN